MSTVINAAIIESKKLLLLQKRDVLIFPGGKREENESDEECLRRENREELNGLELKSDFRFYKEFKGASPHSKSEIFARVYFAQRVGNGEIMPSGEITGISWLSYDDTKKQNVSDISKEVIESLHADEYF